ncbi:MULTISPECIES: enoyl-CoA hydratase-related protein [Marinovum]|uniref:enoyl-CoA hydratase-related protein n=1 Tax=Marinovum TaxID=367771 RepID=UPI00237A689B|nr:enoyl-CoA hydratase-related protein [Marinovum sp. PR37]MDD9746430.1 enoyl-CoA hydratase-related protein [Marinovum sp. PR37]
MPDAAPIGRILSETRGATRILTLDTPSKRNALVAGLYPQIMAQLAEAEGDPATANVILTGAGGFFSAGGDLSALAGRAALSLPEREAIIESLHEMIRQLRDLSKPVIAAVEGGAAGVGASLIFAADMIVAAEDSFISMAYVRAGLVTDGGASGYLAQVLPPQLAKEIALLGDRIPAPRLAELGVVNRLCASGEALDEALALTTRLADGARSAQATILELIDAPDKPAFNTNLYRERRAMARALGGAEAAEGIRAFHDKRAAVFPAPAPPAAQEDPGFDTAITRLFGTRLPIVAGGLMWLSDATYVAAAAHAGIIGFLTAASFPEPEALRAEIRRCRALCGARPFGVNISMLPKLIAEDRTRAVFELVAEEGVRFIETSGRSPEPYLNITRAAGIKVLHKSASLRHACKAEAIGVDAVSIVGAECGGHPGTEMIGSLVIAGLAPGRLSIPWLIGGGIGTGAQLAGILAMGGAGAVVGTRFLVADEIWAHGDYKDRLVAALETDTALGMQSLRNTVRGLANETMAELARVETETPEVTIQQLMPLVSGQHSRRAYETGDSSRGVLSAGQSLGMTDRRAPLAELVAQMEAELRAAARASLHLFEQA